MPRHPTKLQRRLLKVCGKHLGRLRGGLGRKLGPLDVDPKQLAAGIRVELEHTPSRRVACEIALDHLAEHRNYYTRLRRAKL